MKASEERGMIPQYSDPRVNSAGTTRATLPFLSSSPPDISTIWAPFVAGLMARRSKSGLSQVTVTRERSHATRSSFMATEDRKEA